MFAVEQRSLFESGEPAADPGFTRMTRLELTEDAWLDYGPRWLEGDGTLYDVLAETVAWSQPEVRMYDRLVATPRLVGPVPPHVHPVILDMSRLLSERYDVPLDRISAGWYRQGSDSVAWHGDRIARDLPESLVATISLRGPRTFRYRPAEGGLSHSLSLGFGDLVVMGGSFQRTWRHCVPKVANAPPRIALMFRPGYD